MKVRVLGCSGAIAKECRTTSFLLDQDTLIDAGTGVGDLTLEQMRAIDHVFLTHAHLDHVAALPLMVDAVGGMRSTPLTIHALPGTIEALRTHIFNNVIWPDFTRIPSQQSPFIAFEELRPGQILEVADKRFEVLPAVNTVPAAGFAVSSGNACWVFSGDTERNPAFWRRINELPVSMLVIETAFSNREQELARLSLHLSPTVLAGELGQIAKAHSYPIYITHTKPAETELIMAEIRQLDQSASAERAGHDIRWLRAGQEFEL